MCLMTSDIANTPSSLEEAETQVDKLWQKGLVGPLNA